MSLQVLARTERRLRVLIVEEHEVMRLGLRALLGASRWLEVVGDVATVAEALSAVAVRRPDFVVLATGNGNGTRLDGCRELLSRAPDTRIVILDHQADAMSALDARRVGAVACLSRRAGAQTLCRALRELATGAATAAEPPASLARVRSARDVLALTAQERRVLTLVAHGKTNKEIGTALGLSAKTVKNYLSHAFEKLNARRRAEAAVLFMKTHGSIPLVTRRSA
jgi:DNA-binding NarL/FixJ family response regulator